jgi:hypothetical protein
MQTQLFMELKRTLDHKDSGRFFNLGLPKAAEFIGPIFSIPQCSAQDEGIVVRARRLRSRHLSAETHFSIISARSAAA